MSDNLFDEVYKIIEQADYILDEAVRKKVRSLIDQVDKALESSDKIEKINKVKEKIRNMRQAGLERSGEFSVENLAFKILRRNGYLERLYNVGREEYDKSLSLTQESLIREFVKNIAL